MTSEHLTSTKGSEHLTSTKGAATVSATERVYRAVRARILRGELRPNERLVETSVAQGLGTSRTPVREAMQRLAAEGLIVPARQGWAVKEFTSDEIREIFEVRTALEGFATGIAAARASDEQLRTIQEIHRRELALEFPRDRFVQVELNDLFHDAVLDASGNRRLIEACERNLAYYFGYPVAARLTPAVAAETITEHTRIVDALVRRDPDEAEAAARAHVRTSLELVLADIAAPMAPA